MTNNPHQQLTQTINRLDLISHAPTTNPNPTPRDTSTHIGGNTPPGGTHDDNHRHPDNDQTILRSADHYRQKAKHCKTNEDLTKLHKQAEQALRSYTHTPPPTEPEWGTWHWKRKIVREIQEGIRTRTDAITHYRISRTTLWRYQRDHGDHSQ